MRTYNVWIHNEGAPNNHAMSAKYGYNGPTPPPSLSHWGLSMYFNNASHFSPGYQAKHVMSRSISPQELKRVWTNAEIRALVELGYAINPSYSEIDIILNNQPAFRNDYATNPIIDSSNGFYEEDVIVDYTVINVPGASIIHLVNNTTISDNNGDAVSIMENSLFGIRGVTTGGNDHILLQVNGTGTEVTYTPEPGFIGRAQFGYYLWDGKEQGAMEIINIDVLPDPNYIVPVGDELVINGDFEDATEIWTQNNLDEINTSSNFHTQRNYNHGSILAGGHPFATYNNNWFPSNRGIYTYKSYERNYDNYNYFDVILGFKAGWVTTSPTNYNPNPNSIYENNIRYTRIRNWAPSYSTLSNTLVSEIDENDWHYYTFKCELSFNSNAYDIGDYQDFVLRVIEEPLVPASDNNVLQEIHHFFDIEETCNTSTTAVLGSEVWQEVEFNFYYCGDIDARFIALNKSGQASGNAVGFTMLDNISIKELSVETVYDYEVIQQVLGCDASISIWGDNPIEVSWQGPGVDGNNSLELTNLAGGSYTATMTFEGGCSVVEVFEIIPFDPLVITLDNLIDASCGNANGSIEINVTGGNGNYAYFWDNIALTTDNIYNLEAGTYTVTAWDVDGCDEEVTMTFTIEETNAFEVVTSTTAETCIGYCDGTATVSSSDGIINFFQLEQDGNFFNDNNNDLVIDGLCPGVYNLLVESTDGCVYSEVITIDESGVTADMVNPVINGIVTWNFPNLVIDGDLTIMPGSQLTINGTIVRFTPGSRVIVQQTGDFRTFGATLTSVCDEFWGGVELRGNPNMPQSSNFQATCIIFNSEISNALVGLRALGSIDNNDNITQSGGFGRVYNSNFINNVNDIRVSSYLFNTNGYALSINSCNFLINNSFFDSQLPQERIFIHMVHNLQMVNCNFDNMNPDFLTQTELIGVRSIRASFKLTCAYSQQQNCNSNPHINGFTRGVFAYSSIAPYYTKIDRMEFNNFRNVYMAYVGQSNITRSNFYNLPTGYYSDDLIIGNIPWADFNNVNYGIYLYPSTRFNIMENDINMTNNPGSSAQSIGIIADNCGANDNRIYKNTFSNMVAGVLAWDKNREEGIGWDNVGLHLECNDFNTNLLDVWVTTLDADASITPEYGIRSVHGTLLTSAGNQFLNSSGWSDVGVISAIENTGNFHFYFGADGEFDPNEMFNVNAFSFSGTNICQDLALTIPAFMGIDENELALNIKKQEWNQVVDGGNTEALTAEVVLSDYSEALELYYSLMAKSPDLSEKVMIEAIQKEFDLPKVLLTSILASNPQAAKSKSVKDKLDARVIPLEEYQREMINQGLTWVSYKENLEAEMTRINSNINYAFYAEIDTILVDTNIVDKKAAILGKFTNPRSIHDFYYQINLLQDLGDFSTAENLINSVETIIELTDKQIQDLDQLLLLNNLKEIIGSSSTLSDGQVQSLESIVALSSSFVSSEAKEILSRYGLADPYERLTINFPDEYKSYNVQTGKVEKHNKYSVYPNPASNFAFLKGNLEQKSLFVEVLNLQGKVLDSFTWKSQEQLVDVSKLAAGWYSLKIYENNKPVSNIPLTVTK